MAKRRAAKEAEAALDTLNVADKKLVQQQRRYDVIQRFRRIADKAIKKLEAILDDPDVSAEVKRKTANDILDRAYGKAPRTTVHQVVRDLEGKEELEKAAIEILVRRGAIPQEAKLIKGKVKK